MPVDVRIESGRPIDLPPPRWARASWHLRANATVVAWLALTVVAALAGDVLPFPADAFAVVANRHESYDPREVRRVLADDGVFVTQQVGGRDLEEVNRALGAPPLAYRGWDLARAAAGPAEAGLTVTWTARARVRTTFHDVGALVLFLRMVPWQVPDFDAVRYGHRLRALHDRMAGGRPLTAHAHRFALLARRPPGAGTRRASGLTCSTPRGRW